MRLASLAAVLLATPLFAQEPALPVLPPTVGSRVRIQADTLGREAVVAVLAAVTRDSIAVRTIVPYRMRDMQPAETIAIPRSAVKELAAHLGTRRYVLRGTIIGTVAGATILAVQSAASFKECDPTVVFGCGTFFVPKKEELVVAGAVAGGLFGGLIGALVGSVVSTDKWGPVDVSSLTALRVVPEPGGVSARMSVSVR